MTSFSVLPLFSSPIITCAFGMDSKPLFSAIKNDKTIQYLPASDSGQLTAPFTSDSRHILDKFLEYKRAILDTFYDVKNGIFKLEKTEFAMTTSWVTKSEKGAQGDWHFHANCMYSGVLYDQTGEGMAPIEFERPTSSRAALLPGPICEFNIFNSDKWTLHPESNSLVFFPSYLMHRIGRQTGEAVRYSIAFNFFPNGLFGPGGDSMAHIDVRA
jgi:uncharacterized protein (TIGR02466 family)